MGADRWSVCPKCYEEHLANIAKMEQELVEIYGKVPLEVYRQKEEELKDTQDLNLKENMREDWEIYLEGAIVNIRYEASCQDCRFHFKLEEAHDMIKETHDKRP